MGTLARFLRTFFVGGLLAAAGFVLLVPTLGQIGAAGRAAGHIDVGDLGELAQRSTVHARDGSLLAVLHDEENRSPVPLEDVPQVVVDAVLATEDSRFFEHDGVDARGTLRALMTNVSSGSVKQGGSTITQQLVKNSLLTPEKNLNRKLKEAVLAVRLEDEYTKDQILERYLNTVYFGNGAYGVQAAAETYWGGSVQDLDVGRAAFLAGVIRNPVGYDPIKFPELARSRRDLALDSMAESGKLKLDEAERLKGEPIPDRLFKPLPPPNDYFVEAVKQSLLDDERLGETAQERYNAVFKGGLRIETTLDPAMAEHAKAAVENIVPDTGGRFTAALASIDPATGAIRAMVGGRNFDDEKYNLAVQGRRQPGSSFKTLVLAAAIENGFSPKDTINGTSPCSFKMAFGKPYTPGNYEGSRGGVMTLTDATAKSVNCAYVRLGLAVGLEEVVDTARKMGIRSRLDPNVISMPLGSMEVSPLEMASAYATLAAEGIYRPPYLVERVKDRSGKVIFSGRGEAKRALSVQTARVVTEVLETVVQRGTGTRARLPGRDAAGKTGTSQEHQNAWFVGYTPQLSTAVWMGAPVGNVSMYNVGGIRVTGGSYPARVWQAFMAASLAGQPVMSFNPPNRAQIPKARAIKDKERTSAPPATSRPRSTTPATSPPATQPPKEEKPPPPPSTTAPPPSTTSPPPPPPTSSPPTTSSP